MKILFATSNQAKVALANDRLSKYGVCVEQKPISLMEIQSLDINEVSMSKAEQVGKLVSEPIIIEDSALYIHSLNNFPGTFLKPVFDTLGDENLLRLLKKGQSRTVTVVGQLVFVNPKKGITRSFQGTYEGSLSEFPKGEKLRGWKVSRIFIPKGESKTLAEMDEKEWDKFLQKFRENDHYEKFGKWLKTSKNN
jgi:XTP/dITP diphosphohydrolase